MFDKLKKTVSRDVDGDFEQGSIVNQKTSSRNMLVTTVVFILLGGLAAGIYKYTRPSAPPQAPQAPVEFGAIIEQDFVEKDNQSALSAQQSELAEMKEKMQKLESSFTRHKDSTTRRIADAREETKRAVAQEMQERAAAREKVLEDRIAELERGQTFPQNSVITPNSNTVNSPETFGERKLPPRPTSYSNDNPDINHMQYAPSEQTLFRSDSFDSHNFSWVSEEDTYRRTIDNYVPTGTFVTAIVTGGADTNAGVLGQGDTTPVVFQTFHEGILPNGQKSRLNDCTITASAYGEISSSRGIVRTDRLSCIFENGDILDVAVKGTAFNFGRNGIRGTTILKNGEIVQMAGIAGILTGIGETGEALSQTTSTSALGSTSSVTGQDAALNLLGNATSSVGSKLSDYYIGLAELYHPIVEINPGAIVNIVFLEGFPLDPVMAEEYERRAAEQELRSSQSNAYLDVIGNVSNVPSVEVPVNPLANDLVGAGIQVPETPFGRK